MRGFTLRAIPVLVAVCAAGCFLPGGLYSTKPPATLTPTHTYWQGVAAALAQKPDGRDMKSLVRLISSQTEAIRALSPEGVDPALVEATEDVLHREEEVIRIADLFERDESKLKTNQAMAVTFADANRKASEAKKRLKELRKSLNDRHGGGFAPIG